MQQRKNLDEVSFIRPILIVLLVLYHAFAPWCGAWKPFEGFQDNELYWWLGKLAYSFMLPTFVFISGYVWSYQRETLQRKDELKVLFIKKLKRLYIPCLLFGLLYVAIIDVGGGKSVIYNVLEILQGRGHMWFLPMLLWCFVVCYMLLRLEKRWLRWLIIGVLLICSRIYIPFQISTTAYYILYFYIGYEVYFIRDKIRTHATNMKVIISWIVFLVFFVLATIGIEYLHGPEMKSYMFIKVLVSIISLVLTISFSITGVYAILLSSICYTKNTKLGSLYIEIGKYCFGVYLFQQFILQVLYYKIQLPSIIGNLFLPWFGFFVTLLSSILISYFVRLSKYGRQLI